ncbi:MAG: hypothetical protein HZA14_06315 [Nitrospirae bacterium]|nr:hypothetical protein [Nitrospirota bacterium]
MEKELKEYLEGLKKDIKKHIDVSLSSKTEEINRHAKVIYEEFQKRIEIVVEGHEVLDRKIDELKEDIAAELKENRLMTKTLFKDLDYRLKVLERAKT